MAPAPVAPMDSSTSNDHNSQPPRRAPIADMGIPAPLQSSARAPTIASLAKKPSKALTLSEMRALRAAKEKAEGIAQPTVRTVRVRVDPAPKPLKPRPFSTPSESRTSSSNNGAAKKPTTATTTNRLKSTTKSNSTIFRQAPKEKKPTLKEKREAYEIAEKTSNLKQAAVVGKPGEYAKRWQGPSYLDKLNAARIAEAKAKAETTALVQAAFAKVAKKPATLKEMRTAYAAKGKIAPEVVRKVQVAVPKTASISPPTSTAAMKENVRPSSSSSKSPEASTPSISTNSKTAQKENVRQSITSSSDDSGSSSSEA